VYGHEAGELVVPPYASVSHCIEAFPGIFLVSRSRESMIRLFRNFIGVDTDEPAAQPTYSGKCIPFATSMLEQKLERAPPIGIEPLVKTKRPEISLGVNIFFP